MDYSTDDIIAAIHELYQWYSRETKSYRMEMKKLLSMLTEKGPISDHQLFSRIMITVIM